MKKDIVYKLTTSDDKTRKGEVNECQWGPGVTHSGTGKGDLCGPGYIHAYLSPILAILLNPIHANIPSPNLWECTTVIVKNDRGLKIGGVELTTNKKIPVPVVTNNQRVAFAILCVQQINKNREWNKWADEWLSGKDRTADAAYAAYAAYAARAAAYATYAAADAARAAAYAAYAAADAAAYAAYAAAYAAADAAYAAAYAARAARAAADFSFLIECSEKAMEIN